MTLIELVQQEATDKEVDGGRRRVLRRPAVGGEGERCDLSGGGGAAGGH